MPQVSRSIGHRHLCDIDFTLIILKVIHGQNFHAILPLEMRRKSKCILAIYCAVLLLTISGFNKCWINNPKSNWKMGPSLALMVIYQMRCGHNEFVWFPNLTETYNRSIKFLSFWIQPLKPRSFAHSVRTIRYTKHGMSLGYCWAIGGPIILSSPISLLIFLLFNDKSISNPHKWIFIYRFPIID